MAGLGTIITCAICDCVRYFARFSMHHILKEIDFSLFAAFANPSTDKSATDVRSLGQSFGWLICGLFCPHASAIELYENFTKFATLEYLPDFVGCVKGGSMKFVTQELMSGK